MKVFTFTPIKKQKPQIKEVICSCGCGTKFMKKINCYQTIQANHFLNVDHLAKYRNDNRDRRFNIDHAR